MRHGCSRLPCCAPPGALPLFQRVCGVVGRRFSLTALLLKGSSGYAVPPSTHLDTTPSPSLSALPLVELDICNISSFGERAQRDGLPSGQLIRLRGRVERIRGSGRLAFLHLRQPVCHSVQVVCSGKELAKEAKSLTPESIIDVIGTVELTETPVSSTSCSGYEVHARELHILSLADSPLPFPLRDSNTKLDTRLNHRTVDLRTPLSAAMLRIQSHLCQSFRSRLLALDFVEMHSPKVTAAATEGHKSVGGGNSDPATEQEPSAGTSGSAVFCVDYFGRPAYLAQSPQLYKQMALMGDAMRVFEVGPVFRAEKSYTHRHLTEFTGLDAEFVIHDKYTEVLNVLEYVVCGMVDDIQTQHASLLQTAMLALAEDAAHSVAMRGERDSPSVTPTPAHGPIVYEVSTSVLEKYGLGDDTQGRQALRDEYMGRVGGCHGVMQSRILGNHAAACPRVLRLTFDNAVRLLRDNGGDHEGEHPGAPIEDFSLAQERRLGRLIRDRYSVDVYVIDQFPSSARPFYTMPLSDTIHERTRSYDMYLRGEEVCSGAQRMHAYAPLKSRLEGLGISELPGIREYVESFRYGAWPHGGFGLGLERIALFLLGASDIRQVSLFPRDPKRLAP